MNKFATGALIMGADGRGLGIVQSLGRRGVPVWVLKKSGHVLAGTSCYANRSVSWPELAEAEQVSFLTRLAMEAGKDALLEKPITRTLEEADELIEIADRTGRILQVGHLERFNPGALAAKAVTRQPLFFEIHRLGVFSPRSLDVDVVFDLMIHDLDLVLWLANAQVRDVRAVGLPVLTDRVDIANARVEFENGAVANFTASRVSTEKVRKFRYFQPHEYISIDFSRRDALLLSVGNDGQGPQIAFRKLEVQNTDPLEAELESFADCVRSRRPPLVGGREGRSALALAEKVMFCIEEHASRVKVPLTRPAGHSGEL